MAFHTGFVTSLFLCLPKGKYIRASTLYILAGWHTGPYLHFIVNVFGTSSKSVFTLGIFLVHTCEITAGTCQNRAVKCCTCSSFKTNTGVLDPLHRINRSTRSRVCLTLLFWKWRVLKCLIWQLLWSVRKDASHGWNAVDFYKQVHHLLFFWFFFVFFLIEMWYHNLHLLISTLFLFFKGKASTFNELSSLLGHTRSGRTRPPSLERPPREEKAALAQEGGKARRSLRFSSKAQTMSSSRSPRGPGFAEGACFFSVWIHLISFELARLSANKKIYHRVLLIFFIVAFSFVGSFCFRDFSLCCCFYIWKRNKIGYSTAAAATIHRGGTCHGFAQL